MQQLCCLAFVLSVAYGSWVAPVSCAALPDVNIFGTTSHIGKVGCREADRCSLQSRWVGLRLRTFGPEALNRASMRYLEHLLDPAFCISLVTVAFRFEKALHSGSYQKIAIPWWNHSLIKFVHNKPWKWNYATLSTINNHRQIFRPLISTYQLHQSCDKIQASNVVSWEVNHLAARHFWPVATRGLHLE